MTRILCRICIITVFFISGCTNKDVDVHENKQVIDKKSNKEYRCIKAPCP